MSKAWYKPVEECMIDKSLKKMELSWWTFVNYSGSFILKNEGRILSAVSQGSTTLLSGIIISEQVNILFFRDLEVLSVISSYVS